MKDANTSRIIVILRELNGAGQDLIYTDLALECRRTCLAVASPPSRACSCSRVSFNGCSPFFMSLCCASSASARDLTCWK